MNIDERTTACQGCRKEIETGKAFFCPDCGEIVCPDCAKKNRGTCPTVFFSARKVQLKRIFRAEKTLREKSCLRVRHLSVFGGVFFRKGENFP